MGESREVGKRARLTLGVIFYNQEAFVEQAVRGALGQTYSPLQIILSDDASVDDTFGVIQRTIEGYNGPHEVVLNRNRKNLGLAGNVNRVMELATGEIILLAGGDDVSMPNRAARSAEVLEVEKDCLCVTFGKIDFEGTEPRTECGAQSDVAYTRHVSRSGDVSVVFSRLNGAGRAYRRRVFDFFGPIGTDCPTEDSVMMLRCLLLGDVLATPEPQVYYRVHGGGVSQFDNKYRIDRTAIHQQYFRDIEVADEYGLLSADERNQLVAALDVRLERMTLQQDLHHAPHRLAVFKTIAKSKAYRGRRKGRMLVGALRPWKRY